MTNKIVVGDEGANERTVYHNSTQWCVKHGVAGRVDCFPTRRAAILSAARGVIADAWQFSGEFHVDVAIDGVEIIQDGWMNHRYCDIVLGLAVLHAARERARDNGDTERAGYIAGYIEATIAALHSHNIALRDEDIALAAAQIALEHFVEGKPWRSLVNTALHEIGLTQDCKDKEV